MKKISRRACLKRIAIASAVSAFPWPFQVRPALALEHEPIVEPTEQELAAISAIAQQFMTQFHVPGFSVSYALRGNFVYRGAFGFADKAKDEKVTPDHLFRIASTTKPITSVAIFSLIEKGRLQLDAPVFGEGGLLGFDYARSYSERVKQITLTHLLTHTSGGWEKGRGDPMFLNPKMNHKELITWTLAHQPLKNPPGTHYGYSNFGYCLLGRIIEKITGRSYPDFVKEQVLGKCGVHEMRLAGNTLAERARSEVVYYGQQNQNPYNINVRRMDSHGGWVASPTDLVEFLMHVDGSSAPTSILAADTWKTMTTPTPANPGYACGWCVNKAHNYWHNGSLAGTTTIAVRTARELCWAGFANTRTDGMDSGLDQVMWKISHVVPAWLTNGPRDN
ncbi:MAG TPA: serine hydrolase domain-containing protein [Chthoniobacterales bacterium]|jgi:CubicO group peptidase (beta-lactamase class C family)|nr:serine hydrolase domain-containing protein [Chthoniobacterales bacterium]